MNYSEIDISTWKRKAQFEFFKTYENPFFNITVNVDVTKIYTFSKENELSFFYCTLHAITAAVNEVPELRCRIRGEKVRIHNTINVGCTFLHDDETFGFFYVPFTKDIELFCKNCDVEIKKIKESKVLQASGVDEDDLIHCSVLPWVNFTSIKHPRRSPVTDCIPKIVFGKYITQGERKIMPVSLDAHHALVDGFHGAKFFSHLETISPSLI